MLKYLIKKIYTKKDYICNTKRGIREVTNDNEDIHKNIYIYAAAVGPIYSPMKRRIIHRSRRRWKGYTKYRHLLLKWKSRKHARDTNLAEQSREKLKLALH